VKNLNTAFIEDVIDGLLARPMLCQPVLACVYSMP
jgi:hypothetical protein